MSVPELPAVHDVLEHWRISADLTGEHHRVHQAACDATCGPVLLTELAKETVMGTSEPAATGIAETNTQVNDESDTLAERLRDELADHLREQGTIRTEQVDAAVRPCRATGSCPRWR
ncbi:hypothetical protein [Pseudonocardia kunmingensis]|uniref:hypothetical protein n=1 Tax=Pseudonocardia kunmingensis TaxID=630975 RepID=UPI001B87E6FD|nr:hypothetical protein [Pseudonocardia kunmingensis]